MRKLILMLALAAIAAPLIGCGGDPASKPAPTGPNAPKAPDVPKDGP